MASEQANPKKRKLDVDEVAASLNQLGLSDEAAKPIPAPPACTELVLYNGPTENDEARLSFHPGKLKPSVFRIPEMGSFSGGFEVRKIGRFGIPIVHKKTMYTAEEVDAIIQQREDILYDGYKRLTRDLSFWRQKATCKRTP